MVKANPVEVTALVRQQWAELVSVSGARETNRDAPVMRAMASTFLQLSNGQCDDITSVVCDAIRSTDEWAKVHKDTIASMFESMTGRLPSDTETATLWYTYNTDELAERISDLQFEGDHPEDECKDNPNSVDESWMTEFASCYGRDSSVYEYVRLRPMNLDIGTCASTHKECFSAMREVYRQYFDRTLEERDFVKRYVPNVLTSGLSLVEEERSNALCTDTYCDAMLSRLSELYAIMSGDNLSDKEVVAPVSRARERETAAAGYRGAEYDCCAVCECWRKSVFRDSDNI